MATEFEPVFGWGWHQGIEALDVPAELLLKITSQTAELIQGTVLQPALLEGAVAALSFRNEQAGRAQWSATFSGGSLAVPVTGFVQSSGCTPNNSFKPNPLR